MNKNYLLEKAIEIAKEHARSGNVRSVEIVLREVYEQLKKLGKDVEDEQE